MKIFLDDDFLLRTKTAQQLYHDFAKVLPIIDYHCHLPPQQIAEDKQFDNLTEVWLNGDHYKWRAMRTNGVDENYITGNKSDWEKFQKWAETVPFTLRNPLYHWAHLELQRYFGVHETLNAGTAKKIYDECTEKIRTPEYSVKNLIRKMNVHLICTTDDPADSLQYHQKIKKDGFEISVLPAFRPDAAMNVDDPILFNQYIEKIEKASEKSVTSLHDYLDALKNRHDYFGENGCMISDHGLEEIYAEDYTETEIKAIFNKARSGRILDDHQKRKFKSAMLLFFA